ncbi:WD repeat-containing protein 89 [Anoplophora glabripennis]|uniref:WD repeat-containing protein 89 n=1 Tax=Anoplophora glabripennis TaxID=217634 RepID=UPI000874BB30|nr:WD repeat-containing protein 89 [Anoplophora glabripennis]
MTERINKEIGRLMRAYSHDSHGKWAHKLKEVEGYLNRVIHGSPGYSPEELHFGREQTSRVVTGISYPHPPLRIEKRIEIARKRLRTKAEKRQSRYVGRKETNFNEGDKVLVKFHPEDKDKLISGSTDGLINVYDLSKTCEDEALTDSLNTQSSVDQLLWFNENGKSNISCITHCSDLQLWNVDGVEQYKHFTRGDIAKKLKKKREEFTYIAKVNNATNHLLVLAGSNYRDGECLRSLQMKCAELQPAYGFYCNKQRVRSSWYNSNINILLTGGEKGILNVWNLK